MSPEYKNDTLQYDQYPMQGIGNAYAIPEIASGEGVDTEMKMESGPPVHELMSQDLAQPTFAPVEMPAHVPR